MTSCPLHVVRGVPIGWKSRNRWKPPTGNRRHSTWTKTGRRSTTSTFRRPAPARRRPRSTCFRRLARRPSTASRPTSFPEGRDRDGWTLGVRVPSRMGSRLLGGGRWRTKDRGRRTEDGLRAVQSPMSNVQSPKSFVFRLSSFVLRKRPKCAILPTSQIEENRQ